MKRAKGGAGIAAASALLLLALVAPAFATSAANLTTNLTVSGSAWVQLGGYPGFAANFTNTQGSSFVGILYVDITNAAGQTVAIATGSATFSANQKVEVFATSLAVQGLTSGVPYRAALFMVTTTGIPVSTTTSLNFTA